MDKVRLGIVGLGRFSERHLEALTKVPEVEVAAVCSHSQARAEEIASRWGVARYYTDLHEMLATASLDAVDVTTAATHHLEPVLAALDADKHVLVEKPIATTVEDADRMIARADQKGKILMVGHLLRFNHRYRLIKEKIAAGDVGKIGSISVWRDHPARLFQGFADILEDHGAPLLGMLVHDVDLLLWYAGQEVQKLYALGQNALDRPVADTAWAILQFEGGCIGVVGGSWLIPEGAPTHIEGGVEVRGSKAIIKMKNPDSDTCVWTQDGAVNPFGRAYGLTLEPLTEQLSYFARCVLDNQMPVRVMPQEARNALDVTLRILAEAPLLE